MTAFRTHLPQATGELFLTDAGLETDLIFNHGVKIREFAAHTLLADSAGRCALTQYFRGFLTLAATHQTGFILDSPTWKAHLHWADALRSTERGLADINREAINFIADLRDEYASNQKPVVLNAVIGPCGDAYSPETAILAADAEDYHSQQISWLAETDVDMVTAMTFTQASEAIGIVKAANRAEIPIVVSFTVETDGTLPTGQPLGEALVEVDTATSFGAAYFMINCAHPDHFWNVLADAGWLRRIKGIRCNASRCSHAELDDAEVLDSGDPKEFGQLYRSLRVKMPWLNVLGGCCGSDLRHVTEIVTAALGDRTKVESQ